MTCTCHLGLTSRFMTPAAATRTGRLLACDPRALDTFCAHLTRAVAAKRPCCAQQLLPCLAVADAALKTTLDTRTRLAGLLATLWTRRLLQRALAQQPATVRRAAWLLLAQWVRLLVLPLTALYAGGGRPCREHRGAAAAAEPQRSAAACAVERSRRAADVADARAWLETLAAPARTPPRRVAGAPRSQCLDCGATAHTAFLDEPFAFWVETPACSRLCLGAQEQKAALVGVIAPSAP
jgi:hypothetical protein